MGKDTDPARRHATPSGLAQSPAWSPPPEFDGYRILNLLGVGGMGQVFLAQDTLLERPVAVKFIQSMEGELEARERFFTEARAIARLQHPNVVAVYRVGEVDGRPYLISEFVRGKSLEELAKPLTRDAALKVATGLARGLAAAHRQGVVHRDLKPGNAILAEDGQVKLLDFGLARMLGLAGTKLPHAPAGASEQGLLLGTPAYMPPELWMGDPGTFRSDVYSLGLVVYELCAGRHPFAQTDLEELQLAVLSQPIPSLSTVPGMDAGLAGVVDRCLRAEPELRYASGEELREALEQLGLEQRPRNLPAGNPYRGLRPFEAEHRGVFFGRDSDCRAILERLHSDAFVLLAGDSGVGKSSLCRAGVLPAILEGALGAERQWTALTLMPGRRPLTSLAAGLAPILRMEEDALASHLRENLGGSGREIRRRMGNQAGLVFFVDQMEELVTLAEPDEANVVGQVLAGLCISTPGVRVIGSSRGDFLTRLASLPGLGDEIGRALYLVQPLSRERIREAVTGPARAKGVSFSSKELVDTLVDSTHREDGVLPLLQFALAELYERRDVERGVIREEALASLGGVSGALAGHADRVVTALPPDQRTSARRILVQLVTAEGTRAHRGREELVGELPEAGEALEAMVRGRLIVARETAKGAVFEVSHEALIGGWPTLQRWLEEDGELRAARERLSAASQNWERLGRTPEVLWNKRQLREVSLQDLSGISRRETEFLEASRHDGRRRRVLFWSAAAVVVLVFLASITGIRVKARRDLTRRVATFVGRGRAHLTSALALNQEAERRRQAAFERFDRRETVAGEEAWSSALSAQAEVDRLLSEGNNALEAALVLSNDNREAQDLLSDVLLERALLADRVHDEGRRGELLARLAVYDRSGSRLRKFQSPGTLVLATSNAPGAQVQSEHIVTVGRRRVLESAQALGTTPLRVQLPNGCYVLTLKAPGRASAVHPVCLGREETLSADVSLAAEDVIPAGFVYVPRGRFLFGSTNEEERKDFLETVPLHTATTGAFLIARNPTTFEDWIAYLESKPRSERAAYAPRGGTNMDAKVLKLEELPGKGWSLTLQPTVKAFTAGEGEPLVYPGRSQRASQDWMKMPVVGITWTEAAAYLRWLDTSGRVPGARFCSELEWEHAARGADDRDYPHGDELAPSEANFDETYSRRPLGFGPDEVGSHPASRSVYGLDDMAGNVWQWTRSVFATNEYVLRGGCFYFGRRASRSTNREVVEPALRNNMTGLRVCASVRE